MRNRWIPVLTALALAAGAGWAIAARPRAPAPPLPPAPLAWSPEQIPPVVKLPPLYTDLAPPQAGSGEQAVRAYLDTLAQAARVPTWHPARTGPIGVEQAPYPRAYAFLHPDRQQALTYTDWLRQWENVAHVGTIQVEPAGPNRFFVEVERVEVHGGHSAVAFHSGFFTVAPTPAGWRLTSAELSPEDLITVQLGGRDPWRHDLGLFAAHTLQQPGRPGQVRHWRRVVELTYGAAAGRPPVRVRLARQVDGEWIVLEQFTPPDGA